MKGANMKKMVFDYSALKGAMRSKGYTLEKLAAATGIGMSTLAVHVSRGTPFRVDQAIGICQVLSLEGLEPYFCVTKVR